jgi:hypothetical protein
MDELSYYGALKRLDVLADRKALELQVIEHQYTWQILTLWSLLLERPDSSKG